MAWGVSERSLMKVFISWSGNRSRAVAELLGEWVKCVLQATRPWLSTRNIDRGALWFSEIHDQLKETSVGIVCLTQENKNRPWILFESGALAKGLSSNRVCTFLIDLKPSDLEDPLAQFNHTTPERESVWELIRTLNDCLSTNALDERILSQVFATYWDQFEVRFNDAIKKNQPTEKAQPRAKEEILSEILENTRILQSRIRHLESRPEREFVDDEKRRKMERDLDTDRVDGLIRLFRREGMGSDQILQKLIVNDIPREIAKRRIECVLLNPRDSKDSISKP